MALRHLLRTLVFTRGTVMNGVRGTLSNHNPHQGAVSCDDLPLNPQRPQKDPRAFSEFICQSSNVQQYVRTLRLRTSLLGVGVEAEEPVDANVLLGLFKILPRLTTLHLEDIVLSPPSLSGAPLPPTLSLEHLTLGSRLGCAPISASHILDTLSHFRYIGRLRLIHLWEEPQPSTSAPNLSVSHPAVETFEFERCRFLGDAIFTFLADCAAERVTVRTTLPTDVLSAQKLNQFVTALGARLAHLEYTFRVRDMPCPMTLLFAGFDSAAHPGGGAALDLSSCTSLGTLRVALDLAPARLASDLASTLVPTLASLPALPRGTPPLALTLAASLGDVLAGQHLEDRTSVFAQLEDAVLELLGSGRVAGLTFEIEVARGVPDSRMAEGSETVKALFPRLNASDDLHVIEVAKAGAPRVNAYWGGRYDAPW
ncbi:hypothetical protein PsYK624_149060 [Phanerochaete sordida]|uniref:Uncharacterized protein n=1 Tax=Phanerochaete sordida TaxID=48140 RepID=A0A9P3GPU7_9APHY|nr:hypothetical protein PsYK624_149060 [Phanerochaete sordida]